MTYWNDVDALGKIARSLPFILIFMGFVVAASGQFFKSIVEARIGHLETVALLAHKNTTPLVKAFLSHSAKSGKKLIVMDVENEIPFRATWLVVTENDIVVSPIMTDQMEIFPTESKRRFSTTITINAEKVVNEYIELRFRYESVYSRELNNPGHLHGEIQGKYRYRNEQILRWTDAVGAEKKS